MPPLTVYLTNPNFIFSVKEQVRERLQQHLETTLTRAAALKIATGGIDAVSVRWSDDCPGGLAEHDVIINFKRAPEGQGAKEGIVCQGDSKNFDYGTRGLTSFSASGTTSVVYVPECSGGAKQQANVLANVAYHELMHNKANMGAGMHNAKNLTLGSGGSLGDSQTPSDGDVKLLAPHLGDKHAQICV